MRLTKFYSCCIAVLMIACCSDDSNTPIPSEPNLIIKLKFDPNQEHLGNLDQPVVVASGNAAQTPSINRMSVNYIELAPSETTALGAGEIIFEGQETNDGGDVAIDFQNSIFAGHNDTFLTIPMSNINLGSYEWVRVSLTYQEAQIDLLINGTDITGTLASFVGYNSYIMSFDLNGSTIDVNENCAQGYWAFETLGFTFQGQAPVKSNDCSKPFVCNTANSLRVLCRYG